MTSPVPVIQSQVSQLLQVYPFNKFFIRKTFGSGDVNPYQLLNKYLEKTELAVSICYMKQVKIRKYQLKISKSRKNYAKEEDEKTTVAKRYIFQANATKYFKLKNMPGKTCADDIGKAIIPWNIGRFLNATKVKGITF